MLKKEVLGLTWFEFTLLQKIPFIRHGCFSRKGGESLSPFDSLNVQPFPEETRSIQNNREKIQKVLGTKHPLVDLEQVHGVDIAVIKNPPKSSPLGKYDAVITNVPGIPLMIKHADCQPCFFVDPKNKAIAAIHCGWRGNVQNIYEKVVHKMVEEYGTNPVDLMACIGPSLGPCHAEFLEWNKDFPQNFWEFRTGENHMDLWKISFEQLVKSGIKKEHIEFSNICSFDAREYFFSYRRDKLTGRNAACILIASL